MGEQRSAEETRLVCLGRPSLFTENGLDAGVLDGVARRWGLSLSNVAIGLADVNSDDPQSVSDYLAVLLFSAKRPSRRSLCVDRGRTDREERGVSAWPWRSPAERSPASVTWSRMPSWYRPSACCPRSEASAWSSACRLRAGRLWLPRRSGAGWVWRWSWVDANRRVDRRCAALKDMAKSSRTVACGQAQRRASPWPRLSPSAVPGVTLDGPDTLGSSPRSPRGGVKRYRGPVRSPGCR
jgi:hypothetical protein